MSLKKHHIFVWISIFAIAMGIFEGSVVIYLRALYYPQGFGFPLNPIDAKIGVTELIRELASLFMLLSVGIIAGNNFSQKFAWFLYSFAVWDIVYYLFLYLILSWPESLFTWDLLFMLPITWTGPVITPLIISSLMIILALVIYYFNLKTSFKIIIIRKEWIVLIIGSCLVFTAFIWDFSRFLFHNFNSIEIKDNSISDKVFDLSIKYIPESFNWIVFTLGVIIISIGIFLIYKRNKSLVFL